MPELPEVELTRRGLHQALSGEAVTAVAVRQPRLRYPLPENLAGLLVGRRLERIERRGKYLLFEFAHGSLIAHLGMSGSLQIVPAALPARPHDHVDLVFGARAARLHDPRRFGALLWSGGGAAGHPLIAALGIEPLSAAFSGAWLHRATRGRQTAIKLFLMDAHRMVGVGNIYASESLFRAAIHPLTPAGRLGRARCERLAAAVRETLEAALAAGGSSLRDYVHSDGSQGWFQVESSVYGRDGAPCRRCGRTIRLLRQGQRSTYYCPGCQRF
jgi:formamidopyrimidine-DNA glycosylase